MTQLTTTNKSPTRFSQAVVSYRKTLQLNNKNNYFKNKLNPLFAGNINECEQKFKKKIFFYKLNKKLIQIQHLICGLLIKLLLFFPILRT